MGDTLKDLATELDAERSAAVARELTKLFEETRRGALSELADFYSEREVKGEIVILVAPSDSQSDAEGEYDIDTLLKQALRTQSLRDAVAVVSEMTGIKKKEVYAKALEIARSK